MNDPVLSPFVQVWLDDMPDKKLTNGNRSSRQNAATIKSFSYGVSNGLGVKVEVVDEAGGEFYRYFTKLGIGNRDLILKQKKMNFQFGWISQNCNGLAWFNPKGKCTGYSPQFPCSGYVLPNPKVDAYTSCVHTLFIQDIECLTNSGNAFKFVINATDLTASIQSVNNVETKGNDEIRMPLRRAVFELFDQYGIDTCFIEIDPNGNVRPMKFATIPGACTGRDSNVNQEEDGPCGIWPVKGRRPVVAAREWVNSVFTKDRRGIVTMWDSQGGKPRLLFCRSNNDPCNDNKFNPSLNLGTYIVNGGRYSPVMSFQPNFKYILEQLMTGTTRPIGAGEMPAFNVPQKPGTHPCLPNSRMPSSKDTGFNAIQSMNPNMWVWFLKDAGRKAQESHLINNYSNLKAMPIEAELKIQGNPSYEFPILTNGYCLSIIYVNPFRPVQVGGFEEWQQGQSLNIGNIVGNIINGNNPLATDTCNPILSNCNWQISGVNHDITDGAYHTTIRVRLNAPGIELPSDSPLGGCPGGFVFK